MKKQSKPRTFILHFNRFNAKRGDKECWTVHLSDRCLFVKKAVVMVPVETIYKGDKAPQPRAFLKGIGTISVEDGVAYIS